MNGYIRMRQKLGGLPTFDPSNPEIFTSDRRVFFPPSGLPLPGGSFIPAPSMPGPSAAAQSGDWRIPNIRNFMSFTITPSFNMPVLPVDYHRSYILVQNNDLIVNVFLTFGVPSTRSGNNAIVLTPGLGFLVDYACCYTSVYVATNIPPTVTPSGVIGTDVSPTTLPPNI